jgi:hypothetical protein
VEGKGLVQRRRRDVPLTFPGLSLLRAFRDGLIGLHLFPILQASPGALVGITGEVDGTSSYVSDYAAVSRVTRSATLSQPPPAPTLLGVTALTPRLGAPVFLGSAGADSDGQSGWRAPARRRGRTAGNTPKLQILPPR